MEPGGPMTIALHICKPIRYSKIRDGAICSSVCGVTTMGQWPCRCASGCPTEMPGKARRDSDQATVVELQGRQEFGCPTGPKGAMITPLHIYGPSQSHITCDVANQFSLFNVVVVLFCFLSFLQFQRPQEFGYPTVMPGRAWSCWWVYDHLFQIYGPRRFHRTWDGAVWSNGCGFILMGQWPCRRTSADQGGSLVVELKRLQEFCIPDRNVLYGDVIT